jgi:hypothetical protein
MILTYSELNLTINNTFHLSLLRKKFGPPDLRAKNDNEVCAYEVEIDGESILTMKRISLTDPVESLTVDERLYVTLKPAQ